MGGQSAWANLAAAIGAVGKARCPACLGFQNVRNAKPLRQNLGSIRNPKTVSGSASMMTEYSIVTGNSPSFSFLLLCSLRRCLEFRHAPAPEGIQLGAQRLDPIAICVIEPPRPLLPDHYQIALKQHRKMLRNSRSGEGKMLRDLARGPLYIPNQRQNVSSGPVGDSTQRSVHWTSVREFLRKSQVTLCTSLIR